MSLPIILIAIADYRTTSDHLRELGRELDAIRSALDPAIEAGICQVKIIAEATVNKIVDQFSKSGQKVVGFHFAGHANGYQLMMNESADADAFAIFLGEQRSLQFAFLNGCSTQSQVDELHRQGVPVVIATASSILDQTAREVASSFYGELGKGKTMISAFRKYDFKQKISKQDARKFKWKTDDTGSMEAYPWDIYCRNGAEKHLEWSLSQASGNPLFSLPPIPSNIPLPPQPFRYLHRFERKHARVFFGRGADIKQLYEFIHEPHFAPVILLHGQSGVGKSSLLEAGLIPRIESEFEVRYIRRDHQKGLSDSLKSVFVQAESENLPEAWLAFENNHQKPLIVILDQVEEAFTHEDGNGTSEVEEMVKKLIQIFDSKTVRPRGRVILGYRKEYHPDISELMEIHDLAFEDIFIQKLNKQSIIEAITGLTQEDLLSKKYKLSLEKDLAVIIADDLEEDRHSAIAPVLQILLTKMWEVATRVNKQSPYFSIELYQQMKRQGILLSDFLIQKLDEISQWNREAVDSGLVLDILMFHTTSKSTGSQHLPTEIFQRYKHRSDIMPDLLQKMVDNYLLVDIVDKPASLDQVLQQSEQAVNETLSLAHDTLAPLIREMYEDSDQPGPMAERILKNKLADWLANPDKALLDEYGLEVVQHGKSGMRVWLVEEEKMVEASLLQAELAKKQSRQLRLAGMILAGVITLLAIVALWQWRQAEQNRITAESSALASQAMFWADRDLTYSHQFAQQAYALDPQNDLAYSALLTAWYDSTYEYRGQLYATPFYEDLIQTGVSIYTVAYSPDGSKIALSLFNGTIRIYDTLGTPLDTLGEPLKDFARAAEFSADGRYIMGARGKQIDVWDINGKHIAHWLPPENTTVVKIHDADFSSNEDILFTFGQYLYRWNWKQNETSIVFEYPINISDFAISSDGKMIATGSNDQLVRVMDLHGNLLLPPLAGNIGRIDAVDFAPAPFEEDHQVILASGDMTGNICLWDQLGNLVSRFKAHKSLVQDLAFSQDGDYLLSASSDQRVKLWDVRKNQLVLELTGHEEEVYSALFTPGGNRIISTSVDKKVKIWDLKEKPVEQLPGHKDWIQSLRFSDDGKLLLSVSYDGQIQITDLENRETRQMQGPFATYEALWGPEKDMVTIGCADSLIILWKYEEDLQSRIHIHHNIHDLAYIPDQKQFYVASNEHIYMIPWESSAWETRQLQITDSLTYHHERIYQLDFQPELNELISASWDSTVVRYDLASRDIRQYRYLSRAGRARVHPKESLLAVGLNMNHNPLIIHDLGRDIQQVRSQHEGAIFDMAISADLRFFASASDDHTARLWNWAGEQIAAFPSISAVSALAFSPEGDFLLIASADGSILQWPIDPERLIVKKR